MSYQPSALINCPNIQAELAQLFAVCPQVEPLPLLEFVMSPGNRTGLSMTVSPGNGNVRTVQLLYHHRKSESDVSSNQPNPNCSAGAGVGEHSVSYDIDTDENFQDTESYTRADFERSCKSAADWLPERIMAMMNAIDRRIATQVASDLEALVGAWASDVQNVAADVLSVKTLKDGTTQDVAPFALEDIEMALTQTGYCFPGVAFSGTAFKKYVRRIENGCCSDQGIDLMGIAQKFGIATAYDRRVVTAAGSDNAIRILMPGVVQLITYVATPWKDGLTGVWQDGSNYSSTVLVSPQTGIPYDVNIKDDCGTINIAVTATTKLVGLPSDMFLADDVYSGVTYVNKAVVANV